MIHVTVIWGIDLVFRVWLTRARGDNMECINIKQFRGKIRPDAGNVTFTDSTGKKNTIQLGHQKTGFGKKQFLLCPYCSRRVEILYHSKSGYKCRMCTGIKHYKGIKNMTKGGADEIAYRMKQYAYKNEIEFDFPFNYMSFWNDVRVKRKSFRNKLIVLQGLENMRFQAIMGKVTYSPKIISSVSRGKHPLLKAVSLYELKNWVYNWNTGKEIILYHPRQIIK